MDRKESTLANWTPEEIALGKRWVENWRVAGEVMERLRRGEEFTLESYLSIKRIGNSQKTDHPDSLDTSGNDD